MRWRKVSPGVYFPKKIGNVTITDDTLFNLKAIAEKGKSRYCAHNSIKDSIHEMMIFHKKDTLILPHLTCNESYLIIEGELDILIYNELFEPVELVEMGAFGSGKVVYHRMNPPRYRAVRLVTDTLFFEVKEGPLREESTVWADWDSEDALRISVLQTCENMKNLDNQSLNN